jgi:hypothetical protein
MKRADIELFICILLIPVLFTAFAFAGSYLVGYAFGENLMAVFKAFGINDPQFKIADLGALAGFVLSFFYLGFNK